MSAALAGYWVRARGGSVAHRLDATGERALCGASVDVAEIAPPELRRHEGCERPAARRRARAHPRSNAR